MVRKAKVGKQRRDKFYTLAKESGFRSRAAFKLLQLNRSYHFLDNARICVDLCAAPGGWLQVAAKSMPVASVILGVDLYPIKPIPNVKTFRLDITTDKCLHTIQKELGDYSADIVLHDGAPSMGTSWISDAYTQNALTLKAMKLACHVLKPGGCFVTKLFRSRDYFSIIWVAQQLFKNVHSTKPTASRLESSEIFVVCQNMLAAKSVDQKMFDPKSVFAEAKDETDDTKQRIKSLLNPSKKIKANKEGYPENVGLLYKSLPASAFLVNQNYLELLANATEIVLDDDEIKNHSLTTEEIMECLKDIRLLGPKEMRSVIRWRAGVIRSRRNAEHTVQSNGKNQDSATDGATKKEDGVDSDLEEENEIAEAVRQVTEHETQLAKRKKRKVLKQKRKIATKIALRMINPNDKFIPQDEGGFRLSRVMKLKEKLRSNKQTPDSKNKKSSASNWFSQAAKDVIGKDDIVDVVDEIVMDELDEAAETEPSQEVSSALCRKRKKLKNQEAKKSKEGKKKEEPPLSAEELALAHLTKQSRKMREKVIDDAYNRFTGYGDTDALPGWFVDDEEKHCRKKPEVPKELVEEYRQCTKDINVRSSKKIMEAKARQQNRKLKHMQKILKRVDDIPEDLEPSERNRKLADIYKSVSALKKKKSRNLTYIVNRKGGTAQSRPEGKGRIKLVDKRMKKDKRGMKAALAKQHKKRK